MKADERFLSKALKCESGCHEWQSTLHRDGYGKFYFDGKQMLAHRAAYLLFKGEIPEGKWVLHKCDNRKCVNPEHIYLGDAKQNVADKIERCSWWGNMRYSAEIVNKCRELYRTGLSQQAIADMFGMGQTQVSRYVNSRQRAKDIQ